MIDNVSTLVDAVRRAARLWPERTAWTFDPGRSYTFAEVDRLSAGIAGALHGKGIVAGDRVAVLLDNQAEFPLTWLALARLGAAMVPINPRYRAVDASHLLTSSGAVAVVTSAGLAALIAETGLPLPVYDVATLDLSAPYDGNAVESTRVVNVQYTSGTTGSPKGCLLDHTYWTTIAASLVDEFPRLSADDVMLTAQPFSYIDPQWNVAAALLAGAHLVVLDGFHPSAFWAKVREHQVTYFYCLGAMPTLLLRMPADPDDRRHRVRVIQTSGMPPALQNELEERWGVGWFEAFGMTETGADLRVTDLDHDELVGTGCLGRPAGHREARIVEGELWLRGPGMMQGYDGLPDPFVDGWFRTGDLARIDDDGRVTLQGRLKDMIRRSGENIAAYEVESVLMSHPAVRLAAVIGVPDEIRGEEVKAFVVGDVSADALAAYCGERLAAFKVPSQWEFREDLPRTPSERVAKEQLR